VQPSSLIFVAVVAIWVAFLLQHWVRRREAMAIARSVDRFSEAMRLLDRTPVRGADTPRLGLGALSAAAAGSPLVARSRVGSAQPTGPLAAQGLSQVGPVRQAAPRRAVAGRLARRARATALLLALAALPASVAGSATGALPWLSVPAAGAVLAWGVATLRYAAVRAHTRARLDRSIAASRRLTPAVPPAAIDADLLESTTRPASPGERAASRSGLTGPTWSPVPVPRPTYALKDPAPRPEPQPVPVTPVPVTPVPEPAVRPAAEPVARRAVGG
jgi:hypothetical protein